MNETQMLTWTYWFRLLVTSHLWSFFFFDFSINFFFLQYAFLLLFDLQERKTLSAFIITILYARSDLPNSQFATNIISFLC